MKLFSASNKRFKSSTLNQKFIFLLAVLTTGLVVVGLLFYEELNIQTVSAERTARLKKFDGLIDAIQIDVLNARRFEKDFRLTGQLLYLEKYENQLRVARQDVSALGAFLQDEQDKTFLADAEHTLESYQNTFFEAVVLQTELGLDASSGLRNELRISADELRKLIEPLNDHQLLTGLFQMQEQAQTFLSGADPTVVAQMAAARQSFSDHLEKTRYGADIKRNIAKYLADFEQVQNEFVDVVQKRNAAFALVQEAVGNVVPLMDNLLRVSEKFETAAVQQYDDQVAAVTRNVILAMILIPVVLGAALLFVARGISNPISKLQDTVGKIAAGDFDARSKLDTTDEIGTLGKAFDKLLDERVSTLAQAHDKSEKLNDSVIDLLQAVSKLGQKDLTVSVPVSDDVTGPIADSLNLLTSETVKVLKGVTTISDRVNKTSMEVKAQANTVMEFANSENQEIGESLEELTDVVNGMNTILQLAQSADSASEEALKTTDSALQTVTQTVAGINKIRDSIHETEKRIKRLGERSQEIGGMVTLINEIAERTHILALNASMHAASSGEAGRGFMVVANEVQELAGSSRDATSQIAKLVKNIQVDTSDTVNTMNRAITEVVDGTRLAEQAGSAMMDTQKSTTALVQSVREISSGSLAQVEAGNKLRERAERIKESTAKTHKELEEQSVYTDDLVRDADELVSAVRVFKLTA